MKRTRDEQEQIADEPEPFVEKKRKRRLSIKLDSDGIADLTSLSEDEKSDLIAGMLQDEDTQSAFRQMSTTPSIVNPEGLVSPDDIRRVLEAFSWIECIVMPRIIRLRTRQIKDKQLVREGIEISPQVAAKAFTFSDQQLDKLAPLGAQAANNHLPEKIRKWISATGPGAEFLGLLLLALNQQMKTAIILQSVEDQTRARMGAGQGGPAPNANGDARHEEAIGHL